jgi:hypothetical protein
LALRGGHDGAAGKGIDTMLSERSTLPYLRMVTALPANYVAQLLFGVTL